MFTVCVGLVFRSKSVQFPIICSPQYSIKVNTVEVDPHSDLLHICIVKPKNCGMKELKLPEEYMYKIWAVVIPLIHSCLDFQFSHFTWHTSTVLARPNAHLICIL